MISEYKFGKIVIDGVVYTSDVILSSGIIHPASTKDEIVVPNWWREEGHLLQPQDLVGCSTLINQANIIVIGTGAYGMMKVSDNLIKELETKGLEIIIERTKRACEIYNEQCEKGAKVIGALHLTC